MSVHTGSPTSDQLDGVDYAYVSAIAENWIVDKALSWRMCRVIRAGKQAFAFQTLDNEKSKELIEFDNVRKWSPVFGPIESAE